MWHYFYLARCSDQSLYAGTCLDLAEREAKHNAGTGAKYTRSHRPVKFIYSRRFRTLSAARKYEAAVKKWDKQKKEELVISGKTKKIQKNKKTQKKAHVFLRAQTKKIRYLRR
jgi:putative endonuclease